MPDLCRWATQYSIERTAGVILTAISSLAAMLFLK
jgi:hypothetical protein